MSFWQEKSITIFFYLPNRWKLSKKFSHPEKKSSLGKWLTILRSSGFLWLHIGATLAENSAMRSQKLITSVKGVMCPFKAQPSHVLGIFFRFFLRVKYQFFEGKANRRLDDLLRMLSSTLKDYFQWVFLTPSWSITIALPFPLSSDISTSSLNVDAFVLSHPALLAPANLHKTWSVLMLGPAVYGNPPLLSRCPLKARAEWIGKSICWHSSVDAQLQVILVSECAACW